MKRHTLTLMFASLSLFGCSSSTLHNTGALLAPNGYLVDVDAPQTVLAYLDTNSKLFLQPLDGTPAFALASSVTSGGFVGSSSTLTFDVDSTGTGYGSGPRWLWQPGFTAPVQMTDLPVVDGAATPGGELILVGESASPPEESILLVRPGDCTQQGGCPVTMIASAAQAPVLRAAAHAPAVAWVAGGQVGYVGPSATATASVSGISDAVDVNLSDDGTRLAIRGASTLTLYDVIGGQSLFSATIDAATSLSGFVDDQTPILLTQSGTETCSQGSCSIVQTGDCQLQTTATGTPKLWACLATCSMTSCNHTYDFAAYKGPMLFSGIGAPQWHFSDDATTVALYDPTAEPTTAMLTLPMAYQALGDGPGPLAFVPGTHTLVYFVGPGAGASSLVATGDSGSTALADLAGNFVVRGSPATIYYTGSDGVHSTPSP